MIVEENGEPSQNETKEFVLKATGKAFHMLINNLYQNKIKASIIELSQNCKDSHVKAGKEHVPFHVYLPTYDFPLLKIQDFGTGISEKFMMDEYVTAFSSSKTGSNDFDGGFGVGRIIATSLTGKYEAISVFNNVEKTYLICLNERGIPSIQKTGERETEDCNGFTVQVDFTNADTTYHFGDFVAAAREIFKTFEVKPFFPNHHDLVIEEDKYLIKSENDSFGLKGSNFSSSCIQGVYQYNVDVNSLGRLSDIQYQLLSSGLVMKFRMGELDPSASREALHYSTKTIEAIKNKLDSIIPLIRPEIEKNFLGKNIFEKLNLNYSLFNGHGELASLRGLAREVLRDLNIPTSLNIEDFQVTIFSYDEYYGRIKKYEPTAQLTYQENAEYYFVDKKSFLREKARKFFEARPHSKLVFFWPKTVEALVQFGVNYDFDLTSLPKSSSLPFDKAEAGVRKQRVTQFIYHRWKDQDCWHDAELDPEDEIIYVQRIGYSCESGRIYGTKELNNKLELLRRITGQNWTIFGLTNRQIENKPNYKPFHSFFDETLARYAEEYKVGIADYKYREQNYAGFPGEFLSKLSIKEDSLCAKMLAEWNQVCLSANTVNTELAHNSNIPLPDKYQYTTNKLKEKYPIVYHISRGHYFEIEEIKTDMENYINTKEIPIDNTEVIA